MSEKGQGIIRVLANSGIASDAIKQRLTQTQMTFLSLLGENLSQLQIIRKCSIKLNQTIKSQTQNIYKRHYRAADKMELLLYFSQGVVKNLKDLKSFQQKVEEDSKSVKTVFQELTKACEVARGKWKKQMQQGASNIKTYKSMIQAFKSQSISAYDQGRVYTDQLIKQLQKLQELCKKKVSTVRLFQILMTYNRVSGRQITLGQHLMKSLQTSNRSALGLNPGLFQAFKGVNNLLQMVLLQSPKQLKQVIRELKQQSQQKIILQKLFTNQELNSLNKTVKADTLLKTIQKAITLSQSPLLGNLLPVLKALAVKVIQAQIDPGFFSSWKPIKIVITISGQVLLLEKEDKLHANIKGQQTTVQKEGQQQLILRQRKKGLLFDSEQQFRLKFSNQDSLEEVMHYLKNS